MQIQIPTYQTSQTNERQAQVKSGEKVAVTVTEKHSSTEATVLYHKKSYANMRKKKNNL